MYLINKKILFIGPKFHDYHTTIIEKLEDKQAVVFYYPERKYNLFFKIINNLNRKSLQQFQNWHYRIILKQVKGIQFDYLLVIRGYMMPPSFIVALKANLPNINTIMYQWDSDKSNPYSHLIPYFDRVLSFDSFDCATIKSISYLPLFYSNEIKNIRVNIQSYDNQYDFFFIGWYMPERYKALMAFKQFCEDNNYRIKEYIYIHFTSYIKEKLKGVTLDKSVLFFKPLKRKQYLNIISKSKALVDVSSVNQSGLAIRIIEALGAGKKVVTNNAKVKLDLLYSEEFIALIDAEKPYISPTFFDNVDTTKNNLKIIENYYIDNWIDCLFDCEHKTNFLKN